MSCEDVREFLVDLGLDEPTRRRVAEALAHLEACGECRAAVKDYDTIAATLAEVGQLPQEEAESLPVPSTDPWARFERQLQAKPESRNPDRVPVMRVPVFRALRFGGAWAAGLLLAAAGFFAGKSGVDRSTSRSEQPRAAVLAPPTPAEVAGQVRAFNEINADFEGRTGWVSMTRGQPEVGHGEISRPVAMQQEPPGGRLLLVRLKLLQGSDVISDSDLIIIAGQTADLAVRTKAGPTLHYRVVTSASMPNRVELRAEMRGPVGSEADAALATDLQLRPDRATTAGQLVTPGGAYDLAVSYGAPL